MSQAIASAEVRPKTRYASRRCGDTRLSTGSGDGEASRSEAKQVRVDIAQFLLTQGCGSGPRSVFHHRRGPLSVCRYLVSADHIDIARRFVSGKPAGTHPERRAPVWLTRDAETSGQKIAPRKRGHGCGFLRDRYAGMAGRTVIFFLGVAAGVGAPMPLNSLLI